MKKLLFIAAITFGLSACGSSEDFTPAKGATGKTVFNGACAKCHAAINENPDKPIYFDLAPEMASVEAIANKVGNGGMIMPKFPNIQGEELQAVAAYVLEHSNKQ